MVQLHNFQYENKGSLHRMGRTIFHHRCRKYSSDFETLQCVVCSQVVAISASFFSMIKFLQVSSVWRFFESS
jgi:hypothetical protein